MEYRVNIDIKVILIFKYHNAKDKKVDVLQIIAFTLYCLVEANVVPF